MKQPTLTKPYGLLLTILLFPVFLKAQTCDCGKALDYVSTITEANLASYQHQVVQQNREAEYQKHKAYITQLADSITDKKSCIGLTALYLSFFRDEHVFIRYPKGYITYGSSDDPKDVVDFYKSEPTLPVPANIINEGFLGKWYLDDELEIVVVPNKSGYREYAGVVAKGDNEFWTEGQIKFEITKNYKGDWVVVWWNGNRYPKTYVLSTDQDELNVGRHITLTRLNPNEKSEEYENPREYFFKELSDKTNYLRIPSFDRRNYKIIDSLVAANHLTITAKNNLIIDIRGNGGGGDRSYAALLPLVMDNKSYPKAYSASVWVSPGNFRYYDDTKFSYAETKEDSLEGIEEIKFLQPYIGQFTPINVSMQQLDTVYQTPKDVAVIMNRWCASTAEGFTAYAKQNKKVKIYGENTWGMASYGDWRPIDIPELGIWFSLTTKQMVFRDNQDIESIGFTPDFPLDPDKESEWIEEVRQSLEK